MGRDPCKLTNNLKNSQTIQANGHSNLFWTSFLKSAPKTEFDLKKWDVLIFELYTKNYTRKL